MVLEPDEWDYRCTGCEYKRKETPSLQSDTCGLFFGVENPALAVMTVCHALP